MPRRTTGSRIEDVEVADQVRMHFSMLAKREWVWGAYADALAGEFWSGRNPWTNASGGRNPVSSDNLPVKMQVNRVAADLEARTANLEYAGLRAIVAPPDAWLSTPGRNPDFVKGRAAVEGLLQHFYTSKRMRAAARSALELAHMEDGCAFKVGLRSGPGSLLQRLWVDAIPRAECLWDEGARHEGQVAFLGHLRTELDTDVEEMLGEKLPDTYKKMYLPSPSPWGRRRMRDSIRFDEPGLQRYVNLLEFYDLAAGELRYYLVQRLIDGTSSGAIYPIGGSDRIGYSHPDGSYVVPIVPVILANRPGYPYRGIAGIHRVYDLNAEDNLMMTVLANAMRRDMGRVIGVLDGVPREFLDALQSGEDGTIVTFRKDQVQDFTNKKLWEVFSMPGLPPTFDHYRAVIESHRQATQPGAAIQQGRKTGSGATPVSATEAGALAELGEVTTSAAQRRIAEPAAQVGRVVAAIVAQDMPSGRSITVRAGAEFVRLRREDLRMEWNIAVADTSRTPTRDARRKLELQQVHPKMLELLKVAFEPDPEPDPTTGATPPPQFAPELKLAARRMYDDYVKLYDFDDSLLADNLEMQVRKVKPDRKELTDEEAMQLLQRAESGLAAGPTPAPAPVPGPNVGAF